MPMSSIKLIKDSGSESVESSTVSGISAFLGKLWKMVEDPKTDDLIAWGKSGNSFVIKNQIDFAKTILPNYYKHNNIASFIRQLNMYGFHKIISTTSGALDSADNDEIEFTHPSFVRGRPYLLEQIKRKMNNPKENIVKSETNPQFNESIKKVFMDIKHLKGKQESLSTQFVAVKQENEILWRELSLLRQKHAAQQNILNKLIRFLVSLAQPTNHSMAKRRLLAPLMLKDSTRKQEPIIHQSDDHVYTMKKRESHSPGPTIHEIHSSDMIDDVIIDSPDMDVQDDGSVLIDTDLESGSESNISISDSFASSTKPVPAALLRSDTRGKKHIQRVYVTPDQQVSSHFLIPHLNSRQERRAAEYLIPEQTDNPFLELVHETEADSDEYITVLPGEDDSEILASGISETMVHNEALLSAGERGRKKQPAPRKKPMTRKTNASEPALIKLPAQKTKQNARKRVENVSRTKKNPSNTLNSDDFLYDINLETEPMIEVHSPKTSGTAVEEILPEFMSISGTSPNSHVSVNVPLTIGEVSRKSSTMDVEQSISPSALLSPHTHIGPATPISPIHSVNPVSLLNPVTPISPLSPMSPNQMSPSKSTNQNLSPGGSITRQTNSPIKIPDNLLTNQMNECIDDAQNMKITCTSDTNLSSSSKAYTENFSNQIDSMQTDINTLKEMMQNEGLTLDVNTLLGLFSEDPMDYNMPTTNNESLFKSNDEKIMGNELISASPVLDFNDIFSNEWNQPSTPISAYDSDYYSLNTPQIETNLEEQLSLAFAPPSKKIKTL